MFVYELIIYIVFETYIVNKDLHDEYIKNFLKNCKQCDLYYLQKKSNNQKCWVYDQKNPNT